MKLAEALRAGGVSVVLKAATVLAKFLVILYVGRMLTLDALGDYGLLVASLALLVQVIGLDFYLVNNRGILGKSETMDRATLVWDQVHLHVFSYGVMIAAVVLAAVSGLLTWRIAGWLILLGIAEHASQELSRLLVAVGRPIGGNVVLFVRMGAWGWAVLAFAGLGAWRPDLDSILTAWAIASYVSVFIGVSMIRKDGLLGRSAREPGRTRIVAGLKQARVFLVATVAFQVMHLSDRYFIELFLDRAAVGVYTFLYSVTALVSTAVATSVIMIFGPRIVEAVLLGQDADERRLLRYLDRGVVVVTAVLVVSMSFMFEWLAGLLGKAEVLTEMAAFLVLLLGAAAVNLSALPYYRLYARGMEKQIMRASVAGALVNAVMNVILIPKLGLVGAGVATVIGFASYAGVMLVSAHMAPLSVDVAGGR